MLLQEVIVFDSRFSVYPVKILSESQLPSVLASIYETFFSNALVMTGMLTA
jgi:hypothetical protein